MAYSYNEVTATGSAQLIAVPEYVDQSHIFVSINGVDTTSFTWTNANTVSVTATAGTKVRVYRKTSPGARVVDYLDGMSLTEAVLDADSKQAFFLAQEQLDSTNDAVSAIGSLPEALVAIQTETAASEANAAAAASSASSAATSATSAATSATSAATNATAVAANATAAAGSAASAASSASSASASAASASSSEGIATAKAAAASASAESAAASAAAAAATAASVNPADLVQLTGNQTVSGVKTFTSSPVLPGDASSGLQAVPKQQLDAVVAASVDALRDVQSNPQAGAYTLSMGDRGKSVDAQGNITIPANSSVAFPVGTTITVTNVTASAITIGITTDTLRNAGTTSTGTRTLAGWGVATMRKVGSAVWIISGAGLT